MMMYIFHQTESKNPQPFNQSELNDLVRDLGLTTEKSKLLGLTLGGGELQEQPSTSTETVRKSSRNSS
jgi:hypothetical protein